MVGEWREIRVGDLVDHGALSISDGYRVRNEELGPEGIPFVRGGDIGDGWINTDTEDHIKPELVDRVRAKLTQPGDAAFITKGTVGRTGRLRADQPNVVFAPQVAYWRVIDPAVLAPGYIFYLMRSYDFRSALDAVKTHGAMAADYVSISQQHDFRFRFPCVETQRTIAHILGTLDDKIELNRRMNETLEAMARALFKSWFVDFDPVRAKAEGRDPGLPQPLADLFPDSFEDSELGEIPRGWEVTVLDQLVDIVLGGDWGGDAQETERSIPACCIRGADIPALQIGGRGKMPVRFLKPSSLAKRQLNEGDLVVEISGGSPTQSTGRPVLVSRELLNRHHLPLVCSNFCRLLKLKLPAYSKFVYLWLRSLYANDELLQFENGTTGIKNLAFTLFSSSFKLCVAPVNVLEAFDACVSSLLRRQQASAAESDSLAALRDALLPKLISGELSVAHLQPGGERVA